jgi:hypothetical protein
MKKIALLILLLLCMQLFAQEPWKANQLLAPSVLASTIQNNKAPLIISIGPGAVILNSIDMGMASSKTNLDKLKNYLGTIDKKKEIVIYCGCCPFEHCPNIRPAFTLLNQMGFDHVQLLNLATNIKVDWMNKGYPVKK